MFVRTPFRKLLEDAPDLASLDRGGNVDKRLFAIVESDVLVDGGRRPRLGSRASKRFGYLDVADGALDAARAGLDSIGSAFGYRDSSHVVNWRRGIYDTEVYRSGDTKLQ